MKTDRKVTQVTRFLFFIVSFLHLFFNKSLPSSISFQKPKRYKGFLRFFDFKTKLDIKFENQLCPNVLEILTSGLHRSATCQKQGQFSGTICSLFTKPSRESLRFPC